MAEAGKNKTRPYPALVIGQVRLEQEKRLAFRVLLLTAFAGILAGISFMAWPQLDFLLTDYLRIDGRFMLRGEDLWSLVRRSTMWMYALVYLVMVIGLVRSLKEQKPVWTLYPTQWFYLVVCSLAGPLLVTNLVLKTYVGRPRPRSVVEYGGSLDFVPVFEAGGKCVENCSFVSGEVSSMVMIFAALMFASIRWRKWFALALFPAWGFSAFLRVGQGAHFPSDTFFAGVFMLLIAAGLYRLIVLAPRNLAVTDQ